MIARGPILLLLLAISWVPCLSQINSKPLTFHTTGGLAIIVHGNIISVNGKDLYTIRDEEIHVDSKYNRIVEDAGFVFLFIEIDGSPNEDKMLVFRVSKDSVDLVTKAISSEVEDVDGDGYLEFGGSDLTEGYPARDSMYYIPSPYYEIRKGQVRYDSVCTRLMERKLNGIYLSNPLDEHGNCCKVIPKPGKKNLSLTVDTAIHEERINGPANVRDTTKGRLLFQLNDNVAVKTSDTIGSWCRIAVLIDADSTENSAGWIRKGTVLFSGGNRIGVALDSIQPVRRKTMGQWEYHLVGYTAFVNIRPRTIPENVLIRIVEAYGPMDIADLGDFLAAFRFSPLMYHPYGGEYLHESPVLAGGDHPFRLLILFDGRKLWGIVHDRKLDYPGSEEYKLIRGYRLTVVGVPPSALIHDFIQKFDAYGRIE